MTRTTFPPFVGDREFLNTRIIDAPREQVWRAWTEADRVARWWGPKGFRNTIQLHEPRPGGAWKLVMHGPNGQDYPNEMRFVELQEPARIVLDHVSDHRFRITATFEEKEGGTELKFHMAFEDEASFQAVKGFVPECNEQNYDRLEAELARMS